MRGHEVEHVAVRSIVGPWGEIEVVVQQSSDRRYYAVLKQPPPSLMAVVGTAADDEDEAVAMLRLECLRALGGL